MKRDASIYLQDILDNIDKAISFVGDMTYEDFECDEKTFYAVVRSIEIIGEASKNLPEGIRKQHPQVPWRQIAGMRDKAIHSYFGVNTLRVWQVVKDDLPKLKPSIEKLKKELERIREPSDGFKGLKERVGKYSIKRKTMSVKPKRKK